MEIPHIIGEMRQLMPVEQLSTLEQGLALAERQVSMLPALLRPDQPAVDLRFLTQLPGLDIRVVDDLPVSGITENVQGRWILVIRGSDHLTQRRFALAREFWHVLADGGDLFESQDEELARKWEQQCAEYFAASLLMPRTQVYEAWVGGMREVRYLAGYFLVPQAAMACRLCHLGLEAQLPVISPNRLSGGRDKRVLKHAETTWCTV